MIENVGCVREHQIGDDVDAEEVPDVPQRVLDQAHVERGAVEEPEPLEELQPHDGHSDEAEHYDCVLFKQFEFAKVIDHQNRIEDKGGAVEHVPEVKEVSQPFAEQLNHFVDAKVQLEYDQKHSANDLTARVSQ